MTAIVRPTRRQWLIAAAAGCTTLLTPRARAHRAHVALTRLTANSNTGRWEFEHSIHYHDAALALFQWSGNAELTPATTAGRARLLLEIEQRVRWFDATGKTLSPTPVGGDTNGDTIALFQELATPPTSGEVTVESRLLQDVFADETHTVNVELVRPYRILRLDARRARVAFKVGL